MTKQLQNRFFLGGQLLVRLWIVLTVLIFPVLVHGAALTWVNAFDLDMSADAKSDLISARVGYIGEGYNKPTATIAYNAANSYYEMRGSYGQKPSFIVGAGGDMGVENGGLFEDTTRAVAQYQYTPGDDSTTADVWMGIRIQTIKVFASNNFPLWWVEVRNGELLLKEQWNYTGINTTKVSLGGNLDDASIYTLEVTAEEVDIADLGGGRFGEIVQYTANFFDDGVLLGSVSVTDTPTTHYNEQEGSRYDSGYVGFAAGNAINEGVSRGVNLSSFQIFTGTVPEPNVGMLILLGGFLIRFFRKSESKTFA